MSALILIVGISLLILLHEAGHFFAARHYGIKVEEFGFGFPPRMFAIKGKETLYSINWLPFGGFVRLYGESEAGLALKAQKEKDFTLQKQSSFVHRSIWQRFVVISAGVAINFLLGWLILSSVYMLGAEKAIVVGQVADESPASEAGVEAGDVILGYESAQSFIAAVKAGEGAEISFDIERGGETKSISLTPRTDEAVVKEQGAIGVALSDAGLEKLPVHKALWEGLKNSVVIMAEIIKSLVLLIASLFTSGSVAENVVGPVGVFGVANDLGRLGLVYVLQLVGLISLNLAVLNILPIPALDGGRVLFLAIEKIKGSKLNANREMLANGIGFAVLLLLMIALTVRDVVQLF
ncbi:MAG: RIP metalloprotease RseP [Candidatus Paceibacterota bacterium]